MGRRSAAGKSFDVALRIGIILGRDAHKFFEEIEGAQNGLLLRLIIISLWHALKFLNIFQVENS